MSNKIINYYKNSKFVYFTFDRIETYLNNAGVEKKSTIYTYVKNGQLITCKFPNWQQHINKDNYKSYINPDHNACAVMTGAISGITVFDFDIKEEYVRMLQDYPELADCHTVKTNKGYHIYFQYNETCKTGVRCLANYDGVDIRNDKAIVYAAPTKYKLLDGSIAQYKCIGGAFNPVPAFLLKEIADKNNGFVAKETTQKKAKKSKDKKEYVKGASFLMESNVVKEGKTLGDELDITHLRLLEDFKQYLYLIPSQTDRSVWVSIGMAIKNAGGTINDFERFSKLGAKYEAGECFCFKTFKTTGNNYGLDHLKKLARICNEKLFKELVQSDLFEYFDLNYKKVNLIENNTKFIDYELMKTKDKFICLFAYLGKGKTTAIKSYLKENKFKKILFISPRKSFANFIEGEFAEFGIENYMKVEDVNKCQNLIIQMESLHKLNKQSFDVVILDECESILKQFSSTTMSKPIDVFHCLQAQLSFAKKVIFADAFFTNRSLNYIRSFDEGITFIKNNAAPEERDAIEIEELNKSIVKSCKREENNYCVFNSKTELKVLEGYFVGAFLDENKKALFYHADKSDEMDKGLQDINNTWKVNSLVGASPKITVGCSFTEKHFHNVFVKGSASSCCVRDTFQSIMRARHLINNTLFFTIDRRKVKAESKKQEEHIKEHIMKLENRKKLSMKIMKKYVKSNNTNNVEKEKCEQNLEYIENYDETPEVLKDILNFNVYEDIISSNNYEQMFLEFLKRCGYSITRLDNEEDEKKVKRDDSKDEQNYISIADVGTSTIKNIQFKIKQGIATEEDKLKCNKYFFKLIIKTTNTKQAADLFYNFYCNRYGKQLLMNAANEVNSDVATILSKTLAKSQVEESRNTDALRLFYIKKITKILKMKNSQDTKAIDKALFYDKLYPYLASHIAEISTAFNLTVKNAVPDKDDKKYAASMFQATNNIFKSWNGLGMKVNDKNSHNRATINYKLDGKNFINDIQKKVKIDISLFNDK